VLDSIYGLQQRPIAHFIGAIKARIVGETELVDEELNITWVANDEVIPVDSDKQGTFAI